MRIIKNMIYAIRSLFYKKDKTVVLFDAWFGQKFADNPRFLFQYLTENKEELGLSHIVWVTRNKELNDVLNAMGYESYMIDSKESIYYHKKAFYHFCNNAPVSNAFQKGELFAQYSFRAKRINLWHGTGIFKNFNMASNEYVLKEKKHPVIYRIKKVLYSNFTIYRRLCGAVGGWDDCFFLTTSLSERKKFQKCYPLPKNRFIISGYPRVEYIGKLTDKEKEVVDLIKQYKYSILYLPTYRSADCDFDINLLAENIKNVLNDRGILWIQKAHSAEKRSSKDFSFCDNILDLNSEFEINIVTPLVTFVVTDYSSIYADALFYHKPILLYVPDIDEYMSADRGLADNVDHTLQAGVKFYDIASIKEYINSNISCTEDIFPEKYEEIRNEIWEKRCTIDKIWLDIIEQSR